MAENGGTTTMDPMILIDDLRKRGVLRYKHGDLEIILGPLPEKEEADEVDKPVKTGKLGKDGLTAQEQREVYGFLMDAEE